MNIPYLSLRKWGEGRPLQSVGFFSFKYFSMTFCFPSLLPLSCVSIRKPRSVFVHCARQAGFWPFVKDEAEHMSAFLPVALHDSAWLKGRVGPEGGGQSLADKSPRGNLSFSSQHLLLGLWHYLSQPPLSHFFQKKLHFRPGMFLIPQNGVSRSSLASFPSN